MARKTEERSMRKERRRRRKKRRQEGPYIGVEGIVVALVPENARELRLLSIKFYQGRSEGWGVRWEKEILTRETVLCHVGRGGCPAARFGYLESG